MLVWFKDIHAADVETVGGKGANLGEMFNAGFPVPPGFCVSAEAYRMHLDMAHLYPQIEALMIKKNTSQLQIGDVAQQIRTLIEEAPMPEALRCKIQKAYACLVSQGYERVAIRSSATAEDLPEASFAGQQETYLAIRGSSETLIYIKKCWASLWTQRAITYREQKGYVHQNVALAVVVQAMVDAKKAGVLFTVNPLTGAQNEMLINASYGLGESIVSGRVTPDSYCIGKKSGRLVIEQKLGSKETQIFTAADGLTYEECVPEVKRSQFCLAQSEIRQLLNLGMKVERYYNNPQDIEWAFEEDNLYLLQTRPITAIVDPNLQFVKTDRQHSTGQQKTLEYFKEHFPDPPYPIEFQSMSSLSEVKNAIYQELGISMPAISQMLHMDENGVISFGKQLFRLNFRIVGLPFNVWRLIKSSARSTAVQDEAKLATILQDMTKLPLESLSNQQLVEYLKRANDTAVEYGKIHFRVYNFPMVIYGHKLKVYLQLARVAQKVNIYDLLAGLDYKTALVEKALYQLAVYANGLPEVRRILIKEPIDQVVAELHNSQEGMDFVKQMEQFLKDNGARTMKAYLPFANVSWSEDHKLLLNTLSVMLRSENINVHENKMRQAEQQYFARIEEILHKLPGFLRRGYLLCLEQFRAAYKGREATLYAIEECHVAVRKGLHVAAGRLIQGYYLDYKDDVKYLTLSELYAVLNGSSSMELIRQKLSKRKSCRHQTESVWYSSVEKETGEAGDLLHGLPSSPGIAKGIVKVIDRPDEFGKLQQGDILVCSFTDPTWTPLFALAAAIISDTGGPLSHAAIVAREYAIPAVLGTKVATARLKDGDLVVVDGSNGSVVLCK